MIKSSLKFFALVLGLGAFVFGASSCKKDDDKSCCSMTYEGEKIKFCEGDKDPVTGETITGAEWTAAKADAIKAGATCD